MNSIVCLMLLSLSVWAVEGSWCVGWKDNRKAGGRVCLGFIVIERINTVDKQMMISNIYEKGSSNQLNYLIQYILRTQNHCDLACL